MGYSNGTGGAGTFFELGGSGVPGSFLDGGPNALITHSINSPVAGRYDFFVRNGNVEEPPEPENRVPDSGSNLLLLLGGVSSILVLGRKMQRS